MSTITTIGIVIWVLATIFGSVTINKVKVNNPLVKMITVAIALPFVGMFLTVIGLLGLVLLSPVLEIFNWSWFITTNF